MTQENIHADKIQIANISTTTAAKNFLKSLELGKTYFLNGPWGSGKTEFIHEVQRNSEQKFKYFDLWHVVDERSVVTRAFCMLHPFVFFLLRTVFVICVGISFLMTGVSKIAIPWITNNWISNILGIIGLFIAIWSFFRIKSDYVYVWLLKHCPVINQSIIVFDDFDRASPELQKQAYLFFNIVQNKYTIIFLGDYANILLSDSTYLQKIIDMKFALPYALQPVNIWEKYLDSIAFHLKLSAKEISSLQKIVIGEQRNLREQKKFNDLLNQEFYDRKKLNHVRAYDQVLIIYIYLFHEDYYEDLLRGHLPNFPRTDTVSKDSSMSSPIPLDVDDDEYEEPNKNSKFLCSELQQLKSQSSESYPLGFGIDSKPYFISESPSNRTSAELEEILHSPKVLKKELRVSSKSDFYQYLSSNLPVLKTADLNTLLDTTVELYRENVNTSSMNMVINLYTQKISVTFNKTLNINDSQQIRETRMAVYRYNEWKTKLITARYSPSEIAAFIIEFHILSYQQLGKLLNLSKLEDLKKVPQKRLDVMLLLYLSSNHLWGKYDEWSDDLWKLINSLPAALFISFLLIQGLIEQEPSKDKLSSTEKSYRLVTLYRDFEPPHEEHSNKNALRQINAHINEIKHEGYVFNEGPSIYHYFEI